MGRKPERPGLEALMENIALQVPTEYTKYIADGKGGQIRYVKFGDGELVLKDERSSDLKPISQKLLFGFEDLRYEPNDLITESGLIETVMALKRKASGKPEPKADQVKTAKA